MSLVMSAKCQDRTNGTAADRAFWIQRYRSSEAIGDPVAQPELNGELGNPLAAPDLDRFVHRWLQRSYRLMSREYHAIVAFSSRLKSLNVIVKHVLTGFTFYLNKSNFFCCHVLSLDIYSLGRTA